MTGHRILIMSEDHVRLEALSTRFSSDGAVGNCVVPWTNLTLALRLLSRTPDVHLVVLDYPRDYHFAFFISSLVPKHRSAFAQRVTASGHSIPCWIIIAPEAKFDLFQFNQAAGVTHVALFEVVGKDLDVDGVFQRGSDLLQRVEPLPLEPMPVPPAAHVRMKHLSYKVANRLEEVSGSDRVAQALQLVRSAEGRRIFLCPPTNCPLWFNPDPQLWELFYEQEHDVDDEILMYCHGDAADGRCWAFDFDGYTTDRPTPAWSSQAIRGDL